MDFKDHLDAYDKGGKRIDYYWRFSSLVHIALIGWLVVIGSKALEMGVVMRGVVSFVYLVPLAMSLFALIKEYDLFLALVEILRLDIGNLPEGAERSHLTKPIRNMTFPNRVMLAWASHIVYAIIVLSLIWVPGVLPGNTAANAFPPAFPEPSATSSSRCDSCRADPTDHNSRHRRANEHKQSMRHHQVHD